MLVGVISRPVWALDDRGRVLWSSGSATCAAHDLLSPLSQQQVIAAARSALTRPRAAPHVAVAQLRDGAECIVEVALASAAGGLPIALASLSAAHVGQERVRAAAQRYELSRAETRVLELVGAGKSNRDVAAALHVAMATVKSHVRQILAKMGVRSRTQAALVAHAVAPPNADEEPD